MPDTTMCSVFKTARDRQMSGTSAILSEKRMEIKLLYTEVKNRRVVRCRWDARLSVN